MADALTVTVWRGLSGLLAKRRDIPPAQGYIMGFVGRNGAGKTTTIECHARHARPRCRRVELFGHEVAVK